MTPEEYKRMADAYWRMNAEQRQQAAQQFWNDPKFQQFAKDYTREQFWDSQFSDSSQNQAQTNNPQSEQNYTQNQSAQYGQNSNNSPQQYATDKQFDPNERLDESRFTDPNAKVRVQEGTAQQTGRPDYEIDSDARDAEMINNLNAYKVSNPEFFESRDAFNKAFEYHNRKSDRQRAVLDSVWKKKELEDSVKNLKTGADISNAMNSYNLTAEQLDMLKKSNEAGYREYMQIQDDKIKLNIVNRWEYRESTFVNPQDIIEKVMKRMGVDSKLKIQEMPILDAYKQKLKDSRYNEYDAQVVETNKELENVYSQLKSIESEEYAASGTGASRGLIESKISKRTRGLQAKAQALEYKLQNRKNLRDHELAMVNNYIEKMGLQAKEQQRVFDSKLKAYGLSTDILSYETPEQKRERDLEYTQRKQDLELKNKKDLLNLENEMTDLSVTDPKQLRNNLTNVLKDYYKEYSSIIQRPLNMAVNDVLKQAKVEGISVEEALKKNFVAPLQGKAEYKALLNKKLWIDPNEGKNKWEITQDEDWKVKIKMTGTGQIPENFNRQQRISSYGDWFQNATSLNDIGSIVADFQDGATTGQCWAFANDIAKAMGSNLHFWSGLSEKINPRGSYSKSDTPQVGSFAIFNSKNSPSNGHIGVVTKVNADGSFMMKSSNRNGDEKLYTSSHTAGSALTFIVPSVDFSENTSYNADLESYYNRFNDKSGKSKLTSADYKFIAGYGIDQRQFAKQALAYKQTKDQEVTPFAQELIGQLQELKNMDTWDFKNVWLGGVPGTKGAYYKSLYDRVLSSTALQNLINLKEQGATFGALSDNELKFITDASTNLNLKLSYGDFMNIVDDMISKLNKGISTAGGVNGVNVNLWEDEGSVGSTLFTDMLNS